MTQPISRRAVAKSTAWATPALALGAAAPVMASSTYGERIAACPPATSLSTNSASMALYPSDSTLPGDAEISFSLSIPAVVGNHGGMTSTAVPLPFNANPYFTEAPAPGTPGTNPQGTVWDVTGATPFPVTGLGSGYSLAYDAYPYNSSMSLYFMYIQSPATVKFGIATPDGQLPQGCLSFQFQLGYSAGGSDPNGTANTRTSRPVPDESDSYCTYYFNGCFDAAGNGTDVSITSSPLHT